MSNWKDLFSQGTALKNSVGQLRAVAKRYTREIVEGSVTGESYLSKYGRGKVTVNVDELLWDFGGVFNWQAADVALQISSSDAADTQQITVSYGDLAGVHADETVALNGQTAVNLAGSAVIVYRAKVALTEASAPAGTVYISKQGATLTGGVPNLATDVLATIAAGDGQTMMAVWQVPAGKTLYLTNVYFSVTNTKNIVLRIWQRSQAGAQRLKREYRTVDASNFIQLEMPLPIDPLSYVYLSAYQQGGTGSEWIDAGFDGYYK